jgi:6-phosphogluconolactonase
MTDTSPLFHSFPTRHELADALAEDVFVRLRHAIEQNDEATLVVSGGSTPAPFFKALAAKQLDWSKLTILVADERWVDVTSDESNEKLVREYFTGVLNGVIPAEAGNQLIESNMDSRLSGNDGANGLTILSLAPLNSTESPEEGCERIADALNELPSPLDVVILGMGEDGHTASLFPHHPQLEEGLTPAGEALCLAITDSPKPPANRITLTARLLLDCDYLVLHITGDAKRAVYERALTSDIYSLPIAAFITQPYSPLTTYWAA